MFISRKALFVLSSMLASFAVAYEARTVSITDTLYEDGLATSFDLAFGAGSAANALYVAYGSFDGGADPKAWQNLVKLADIAPGTSTYTAAAPTGWGTTVNALRFFMADVEQGPYDYALEYLASSGVQGIDTGRHLLYGETFTLVWRQYDLTGISNEDKGWGTGTSGANNITGGGRRRDNYLQTYIRQGHRQFSPSFPVGDLTTDVVYRDVCTVSDPISYTMTALDGPNAGSVWTLATTTLSPNGGANYDSGLNIYLFRDAYGNTSHPGKKAIYRATLQDANGDLVFDFIPVVRDGTSCFYDKVSGTYKYNCDSGDFFRGPQAGVKKGEIGATEASAPVFATDLPLLSINADIVARGDGTATIPYNLSSAGADAATADVLYRVGYAPDALGAEMVAASGAMPGLGSFSISGLQPERIIYVSAYARSTAGTSSVVEPVAFFTPEAGATGRTFAMTATNRVSGAIVSVGLSFSASQETNRLYMAYGAADGGDDPADWDHLKYVGDVAPYVFSQTVAVPAGWGDTAQALRFFLGSVDGLPTYDSDLEYIASTGSQGIDTGVHFLYGQTFTLDWRQYATTGLTTEDKGWGTGNDLYYNIAGGGRRHSGNIKAYLKATHYDFNPVFKAADLTTDVIYRDVCVVGENISYTMTALTGDAAGFVWTNNVTGTAPRNGSDYDSRSNIFLFRDYNNPYPGKKAIYRATLTDTATGNKIFDLIPVIKDGKPCMCDLVSKTLKYNVDSGDFVAGPAVDPVVLPSVFPANTPTLSIAGLPVVVAGEVTNGDNYTSVSIGYDVRSTGGAASVAVSILYGPSSDALSSSNLLAAAAIEGAGAAPLYGLFAGRTYYARLIASANGVASEPSPVFSFTCPLPPAAAGGNARQFTGVSVAHGSSTATFSTYGYATPLYAAYGAAYGGETTNGWENVVKVGDIAPSATSATFQLPAGWGITVKFLRFFFVIDGADVDVEFLDHIVANGREYIDTGLYPDSAFVARVDCQTSDTAHDKMIFGERHASHGDFNFLLWFGYTTGTSLAPSLGIVTFNGRSTTAAQYERVDLTMGLSTGLVVNGSAVFTAQDFAQASTTATAPRTLKLMGLQTGNDIDGRKFFGSLYAFQAWQDDTLVQSLVPCRMTDGSDEVALFDLVTGAIFRNAGNGAFGAGEATGTLRYSSYSGLLIANDGSAPVLGEVSATGEWRGDCVTVSGTLSGAGAGDCTIMVETSRSGNFTDAVVWTASGTYGAEESFSVELYDADTTSPRYIVPGATLWYRVKATDRAGSLDASVPAAVTTQAAMAIDTPSISSTAAAFLVTVPVLSVGANTNWAWVAYSTADNLLGNATDKVEIPYDFSGASFTIPGIADTSEPGTLYWALVISNDCSTAVWVTRTAMKSQPIVNNARYTWKKSVTEGDWENAANWDAPEGRFAWPTINSTARFENATTTTVTIASSLVEVSRLNADTPNLELTFTGGRDHKLRAEYFYPCAEGGKIVVSNLTFEVTNGGFAAGRGRTIVFHDAYIQIYNGAGFGVQGGPDRHLVISGGTYLRSSGSLLLGGAGSTVTIDDSYVDLYKESRGVFFSNGYVVGGELIFKGRNARLEAVEYFRCTFDITPGGTLTFVIPEGGYASTPIRQIASEHGATWYLKRPFCGDEAATIHRAGPMAIRIDPESPGLRGGALRQTLVEWKSGLSLGKMTLGALEKPRSNYFVYSGGFDSHDDWTAEWTDTENAPCAIGFRRERSATLFFVQ